MLDFPFVTPSIGTGIYCLLFYTFILLVGYNKSLGYNSVQTHFNGKKGNVFIIIFGFFLVTHCMQGDFFHFMQTVHSYDFTPGAYNYGENIYLNIGKIVNKNYFLFRLIVFGGAFYLFLLTARRFSISPFFASVFLVLVFSNLFAYARATAAMAVYFYGISFLCKPLNHKKIVGYFWGLFLIILSCEFHNSALVMVIMTPLIFLPIKRWMIICLVISLPLVLVVFKEYFFIIAMSDSLDNTMANRMMHYSDASNRVDGGLGAWVISILRDISIYVPILIVFTKTFFNKKKVLVQAVIKFNKVILGLFFVSTIFRLLGGDFVVFYYRILFMTILPSSIVILFFYKEKLISRRIFIICINMGLIHNLSQYFYYIYNILS